MQFILFSLIIVLATISVSAQTKGLTAPIAKASHLTQSKTNALRTMDRASNNTMGTPTEEMHLPERIPKDKIKRNRVASQSLIVGHSNISVDYITENGVPLISVRPIADPSEDISGVTFSDGYHSISATGDLDELHVNVVTLPGSLTISGRRTLSVQQDYVFKTGQYYALNDTALANPEEFWKHPTITYYGATQDVLVFLNTPNGIPMVAINEAEEGNMVCSRNGTAIIDAHTVEVFCDAKTGDYTHFIIRSEPGNGTSDDAITPRVTQHYRFSDADQHPQQQKTELSTSTSSSASRTSMLGMAAICALGLLSRGF